MQTLAKIVTIQATIMASLLPTVSPEQETKNITLFIKDTLAKQHFKNAVIGLSGGIDSTTVFYLLKNTLDPKNIFIAHLPYVDSEEKQIRRLIANVSISESNIAIFSIEPLVKAFAQKLSLSQDNTQLSKMRLGNIMTRIRMILLYDIAKKQNALVVGTENKSESLLGYFTRFGDEASDLEPIKHLYKTQVYQLAKHLGIPSSIIKKTPTAGLWEKQTDEKEFGFSYQEADQVLYLYYDQKKQIEQIIQAGLPHAQKIIEWSKKNWYKHEAPYLAKKSLD